jgi:hypothetical protein
VVAPAAYVLADGRRVTPMFLLNNEAGGGIVAAPASFRLPNGQLATAAVLVDEDGNVLGAPVTIADVGNLSAQPARIESMPVYVATGAFTPVANQAYLSSFRVGKTLTISTLSIFVAVSSGNVDLGIYRSDGTTLTKIASTGSTVVAGTAAWQTIALTASVVLVPGYRYYLAAEFSVGATISVHRSQINATVAELDKRAVSIAVGSFPLPATITLASTAGTSSPVTMVGL